MSSSINSNESEVVKKKALTFEEIPVDMSRDIMKEKSSWFMPFLIVSFALVCAENVSVAFKPEGIIHTIQLGILFASTVLFFFGIGLTACNFPPDDKLVKGNAKFKGISFMSKMSLMFDGEVQIEAVGLLFGWLFIFSDPGETNSIF